MPRAKIAHKKIKKMEKSGKTSKASQSQAAEKKRRFRPGTVALREIKKYQKIVDNLLPRAPF